jgi:hypothetical protein
MKHLADENFFFIPGPDLDMLDLELCQALSGSVTKCVCYFNWMDNVNRNIKSFKCVYGHRDAAKY